MLSLRDEIRGELNARLLNIDERRGSKIGWSTMTGLISVSTTGWLLQAAWRRAKALEPWLLNVPLAESDSEWEAPDWYYFEAWLAVSLMIAVSLWLRRRPSPRRGTAGTQAQANFPVE